MNSLKRQITSPKTPTVMTEPTQGEAGGAVVSVTVQNGNVTEAVTTFENDMKILNLSSWGSSYTGSEVTDSYGNVLRPYGCDLVPSKSIITTAQDNYTQTLSVSSMSVMVRDETWNASVRVWWI